MTTVDLLAGVRLELAAAGVARAPSSAGTAPPLFVEPEGGIPEPGAGKAPERDDNLVMGLLLSTTLPEGSADAYRRRVILDVRYRCKGSAGIMRAMRSDAALVNVLTKRPGYATAWDLPNGVHVLEASLFSGLGRIASGEYVTKILLETLATTD